MADDDLSFTFERRRYAPNSIIPLREMVVDRFQDTDPLNPIPSEYDFTVENNSSSIMESVKVFTNLPDIDGVKLYDIKRQPEYIEPFGSRRVTLVLYARPLLEIKKKNPDVLPEHIELLATYKERQVFD